MKQALDCYEQLSDAFFYASSSYLRLDLQEATKEEARNIIGGASYLFDAIFAKEKAGSELTRAVYEDNGDHFDPKALSSKATSIRLAMDKTLYPNGGTPFRDYYKWILPSEKQLSSALLDEAGLLSFATIDALVSLLSEQNKECASLRIAEIIFLNLSRAFERIFRAHFEASFLSLPSASYFSSVEEENERIRASIDD